MGRGSRLYVGDIAGQEAIEHVAVLVLVKTTFTKALCACSCTLPSPTSPVLRPTI